MNYLGYPGTMGAPYIDYLIADEVVVPPEQRDCYAEQVVYLPDSFQVNDRQRRIAERTPTRAEAGLPEHGFVFCSFNNHYKITPAVFSVWMRVLQKVDGSVLWLLAGNDTAVAQPEARGSGARRGARAAGVRAETSAGRASGAAAGSRICSWTRCPATRTRRRATRCGRDCRC